VHFDGDPEEFADGDTRRRLAHSKNMDTSFVENLPEGTVVTDGVAYSVRVPSRSPEQMDMGSGGPNLYDCALQGQDADC
jgi:hypothetical protein